MALKLSPVASVLRNVEFTRFSTQGSRSICTSSILCKVRAGRYRQTPKRDFPLTYEMAQKPNQIAATKAWKSWNTSNLFEGVRKSETAVEDIIIRKFMYSTWHDLFVQDIIIKRRFNVVIIAGIVHQNYFPRKMYFLQGYSEQLLSYILKCPVKIELQSVNDRKDVVFKYV